MSDAFTIKEIRTLLEMLEKHEVTEFQIERGEERIWLRRGADEEAIEDRRQVQAAPAPIQQVFGSMPSPQGYMQASAGQPESSAASVPVDSNNNAAAAVPAQADAVSPVRTSQEITSMVGTFYRRPAVDAESYVDVGDVVKKGDVLCIVEAMKLMNEIETEISGTVAEVCLEDGQMVEYGEVLFRIEPR